MKKITGLIVSLALVVSACQQGEKKSDSESKVKKEKIEGKGGRVYGGTLKISSTEKIQTLFPPSITDAKSAMLASQVHDGLIKFSQRDLSIQSAIAEKWEKSEDGKVYTFYIRKGAKFQDDPVFPDGKGREITAKDVKYMIELTCTKSPDNDVFVSTFKDRLAGANEYYSKSASEIKGVKLVDDYTIQLTLNEATNSFVYLFAHPALSIVAKEAVDKYGKDLKTGAGPFIFAKDQEIDAEEIVLVRNDNYYGKDTLDNQLPFLDTVVVKIIDSKKEELDQFKKGSIHVVDGLPSESIREIVEEQIVHFQSQPPKFILDRSPEMGTNYYQFNLTRTPFDNKKVRKAFNYAIDRQKIIEDVLKGEAYGPGIYGIIPPTFSDYDVTQVPGFSFEPEKARKLLAEAGYPGGQNFPTVKLELNSGGYKNTSVAFEIQKQLMENLNVNIDLEVVPFAKKLEDERYGRAEMFRTAWIADYPDPQNFLFLFYGKSVPESLDQPSYPNVARYQNPEYDALYEKAITAKSQEESYKYFLEAEKILMNDAPFIALWYNEEYKLIHSNLRNYFSNALDYVDYSTLYFKEPTAKITKKGQ